MKKKYKYHKLNKLKLKSKSKSKNKLNSPAVQETARGKNSASSFCWDERLC